MTIAIDSLVEYGFKEFPVNQQLDRHDRNWQYCKRTEQGRKFHVQVRFWAFSKYSNEERTIPDSFDAECRFKSGDNHFTVIHSVNNMTPSQIVEWFNNVHDKLNCDYYEKYETCTTKVN